MRTNTDAFKVNYYMDEHDNITQLDYEGAPLAIKVKPKVLESENDVAGAMGDNVVSPMPGTVVKVFVKPGEKVTAGQALVSVESMKMEYLIKATNDAVVDQILAVEGNFVNQK